MNPPKRVNNGCGSNVAQGWVNIDRSPGPLLDRLQPLKRALFHRLARLFGANIHLSPPLLWWRAFSSAGFVQVDRKGFREGDLSDLQAVEHREESFFLEAVAP